MGCWCSSSSSSDDRSFAIITIDVLGTDGIDDNETLLWPRRLSMFSSSLSVFSGDGSRLSSKFAGNNSSRRLAMLDWINKQAAGGYVTMEDF